MNFKSAYKSIKGKTDVIKVYDDFLEKWLVPYEEVNRARLIVNG